MDERLRVSVIPASGIASRDLRQIIDLCSDAFATDYSLFLNDFVNATHVVAHLSEEVVSHALWLPRQLVVDGRESVQSAYVEGVATWPRYQRRGFGSAVMRRLHQEISGFDFGALSTGVPRWYERLGWRLWEGRKFIRRGNELTETPEESILVYEIAGKPLPDRTKSLTAAWRPNEPW
jgi:aminoglycoside 2'-N-acetyltransferase I